MPMVIFMHMFRGCKQTFRHKKIHSAELKHAWIGAKDGVKKEQNNDKEDYEEL